MNNDIYVVTKYWNNGEPWGDNAEDEEPIAAFNKLENAEAYCLEIGYVRDLWKYATHIREYEVFKNLVNVECPIGDDWQLCDHDYNEDYCDNCSSTNHSNYSDYSFEYLKIYKVSLN